MLLGQALITMGFITEEQLNKGLKLQENIGLSIGAILMEEGFIDEDELTQALAFQEEFMNYKDFEENNNIEEFS